MGSLSRSVLLKDVFSHGGRKVHRKFLSRRVSGSGRLASCARFDFFSTQAPLDDKTLSEMAENSSGSQSRPQPRLTKETARNLARNFTPDDRQLLFKEIQQIKGDERIMAFTGSLASLRWRSRFGRPASVGQADPTGRFCPIPSNWLKQRLATSVQKPTPGQLLHTALFNSIPFIGFGFLDNVIMITAGDYIEASMGVAFGISTMGAAALGNAVSDVAGIGSAFYVEVLAMRIGVPAPNMTPEQHDLKISHWAANVGRAFGVALGCIIGMFPLFFLPGHGQEREEEEETAAAATEGVSVVPTVKAEAATAAAAASPAPVAESAKVASAGTAAVSSASISSVSASPAVAVAADPAPTSPASAARSGADPAPHLETSAPPRPATEARTAPSPSAEASTAPSADASPAASPSAAAPTSVEDRSAAASAEASPSLAVSSSADAGPVVSRSSEARPEASPSAEARPEASPSVEARSATASSPEARPVAASSTEAGSAAHPVSA